MKPETIMWLFPIMFMIHDFEEIIFMKSWGKRHAEVLDSKLHARIRKLTHVTLDLSLPAFAYAVMLIFLLISIATLICVEFELYAFWLGMVTVYFLHTLIHILQSIYLRMYIPAVVTSLLTGIYGVYALYTGFVQWQIPWSQVGVSILISLLLFVFLFLLIIRSANWFELRLQPHKNDKPPL